MITRFKEHIFTDTKGQIYAFQLCRFDDSEDCWMDTVVFVGSGPGGSRWIYKIIDKKIKWRSDDGYHYSEEAQEFGNNLARVAHMMAFT